MEAAGVIQGCTMHLIRTFTHPRVYTVTAHETFVMVLRKTKELLPHFNGTMSLVGAAKQVSINTDFKR